MSCAINCIKQMSQKKFPPVCHHRPKGFAQKRFDRKSRVLNERRNILYVESEHINVFITVGVDFHFYLEGSKFARSLSLNVGFTVRSIIKHFLNIYFNGNNFVVHFVNMNFRKNVNYIRYVVNR